MDLENLKKTWEKVPSNSQLDENQLREILGRHTKNVIERIERNIKIGFGVLFVLILIFALDDLIISPQILKSVGQDRSIPNSLIFLGVFSNSLIIATFIYFVIKYYRVKRSCDIVCNLKDTLVKIIDILKIYQRMFYMALAALTFTIAVGFAAGIYKGVLDNAAQQGIPTNEIGFESPITTTIVAVSILFVITFGIFIFLRWGFRKLYGNYLQKLKLTLLELQEMDE